MLRPTCFYDQKGKYIKQTEIEYKLSVQLQYEQFYAEFEGKLPIGKQKWSDLIHTLFDVDEM